EGSKLEEGVDVGPFSHLRPGSHLKRHVHIGNFVEVKNSSIGEGTASGHFSYIGDAELGSNVNIGAGSITCNYDGVHKHKTEIGDDVFIGCDTMLIAPVKVGDRAATGAGAVVTKDVAPDTVVVGVPAKELKKKPS
ncbi:MAG: UDP-N-acetylglucosamine diphosphorylase/glucosamine-1-phosphate N-acetyltransferase, partial [Chloroflexi bacterium]|nr:UDP-N-acetylglucosamine diphosphorylase/glucosamine-1-phosphate N-acetyltransferase [Chloroflexota bacterium]